jgi:menaquinone-9 beta-reductase
LTVWKLPLPPGSIEIPLLSNPSELRRKASFCSNGGCMVCDTDVLIVGGGPAGLAAAIAARARGFRVIVTDGAKPPITKACGEGLLPDALEALGELGVELREADGYALRGIRFEDDRSSVSASFPDGPGLGVRREILHQRMIGRAQDCGVSFLWNTPVTGLFEEGVVAGGNKIRARWVIGADGSQSRVRRWCGLENMASQRRRFAFRVHYHLEPWSDFTEIHWGQDAQAYVTAVGGQEICVVLISNKRASRFDETLRRFPKLCSRLKGAVQAGPERGAVTGMFNLGRVWRGNVVLIGDASGSVDAITGEGLSLSFRQAMALADALEAGDLESYQKAHRRLFRRPRLMGQMLLLLDRRNGLRERTMRALEASPQLFERMLAYHVGETRPLQLAAASAAFGWQFLAA